MQTNRNFSKNYAPFILHLQEKVLLKKLHKKQTVTRRAVRQALYSFFDEYDFAGKTIIPFNAHNGSRFSNTIETIAELEPDAEVIEMDLQSMRGTCRTRRGYCGLAGRNRILGEWAATGPPLCQDHGVGKFPAPF